MPKTKGQGIVFGIIMSITMAYGMEVYNVAIKNGCTTPGWNFSSLTNEVFLDALIEASYMWVFVFIFSNLWGNRLGHKMAAKIIRPEKDNPFFITVITSCCTVLIMCPTMSLVASVLFNIILAGQSPVDILAIWVGTVLKNFPMALLWNLFAAGPVTRALFRLIFRKQLKQVEETPETQRVNK